MPKFGESSLKNLSTCHPNLQRLANEVIKYVDHTITCGHRGQAEQDKAFAEGKSKLKWPNGEHNKLPSMAIDIAPYPIDWNDAEAFTLLAGVYYGVACMLGIKICLGIDWDGDFKTTEHKFKDRPHIELKGE
jgi:hypothetical protein